MRLGMFMHPIHDFKRGYDTLLFEDLDVIRTADQEGFDEVWLGEHYLLPSEPFASPLMLYARLIAECPHITFGSGVLCLPNKHPALVAGEVAQFDHLAKGRFMLGVGPGAAPPARIPCPSRPVPSPAPCARIAPRKRGRSKAPGPRTRSLHCAHRRTAPARCRR